MTINPFQMWACAKGHEQAATTLFHWNSATLKIRNKQGLSPLEIAQENGHTSLYNKLCELQGSVDSPFNSGNAFSTAGSVGDSNPFPDTPLSHDLVPSNQKSSHDIFSSNQNTTISTSACDLFKSPPPVSSHVKAPLHIDIPPNSTFVHNSGKESLLVRRQSDQALPVTMKSRRKLSKRFSVDIPSHSDESRSSRGGSCDRPIREANSEPHLYITSDDPLTRADNPMLSENAHNASSPDSLLFMIQDGHSEQISTERFRKGLIKMDTGTDL